MTKRLTALEITPPDSTQGEQPFTQAKALSLALAALHALAALAGEALFPVSHERGNSRCKIQSLWL